MEKSIMDKNFDVVTIFDKPVLFTCERIKRDTVPDGIYCYDIRHDDECQGIMVELKDFVLVNHWGTILSKKPFEPREYGGKIFSSEQGIVIEDDDYNFVGDEMKLSEYLERYDELCREYCEQKEKNNIEMS